MYALCMHHTCLSVGIVFEFLCGVNRTLYKMGENIYICVDKIKNYSTQLFQEFSKPSKSEKIWVMD